MKILVVDDSSLIAGTIVRVLKKMLGVPTIVACASAELALRYLNAESFDILLTDWHLPQMSGMDLMIQARKSFPNLRIIFMTASPIEEVEDVVKEYADAYLAKPFQVSTLVESIRRLSQRLAN